MHQRQCAGVRGAGGGNCGAELRIAGEAETPHSFDFAHDQGVRLRRDAWDGMAMPAGNKFNADIGSELKPAAKNTVIVEAAIGTTAASRVNATVRTARAAPTISVAIQASSRNSPMKPISEVSRR